MCISRNGYKTIEDIFWMTNFPVFKFKGTKGNSSERLEMFMDQILRGLLV